MQRSVEFRVVVVVLACLTWAPAVVVAQAPQAKPAGGDWPQFRGPNGSGVAAGPAAPVKWGPAENVLWKTPLPGAGTSSPILIKDRIFLTAHSGYAVPGEGGGDIGQLKR